MHRLFFFFSSRRRHTRYWRDWSSDVCSSDLYRRPPVLEHLRLAQVIHVERLEYTSATADVERFNGPLPRFPFSLLSRRIASTKGTILLCAWELPGMRAAIEAGSPWYHCHGRHHQRAHAIVKWRR